MGKGGGEGRSTPPPLGAFGLADAQSSSRGCGALFAFSLLHLFFPPLFLRVGGEKLEALSFPPLRHTETCWGLSKQQFYHLFGSICCSSGHFSQTCKYLCDSFSFLCGFLYFAAALLGSLCFRTGSDGPYLALAGRLAVLLNVRQVSLRREAA